MIFSLIGGNYLNALKLFKPIMREQQHEYFLTHFIPLLAGGHSRYTHIPRMRSWISLAVGTNPQTDICSLWVTGFIHPPFLTFPIHTLNLTLAQWKFPWRDFGKHTATQLVCSSTKLPRLTLFDIKHSACLSRITSSLHRADTDSKRSLKLNFRFYLVLLSLKSSVCFTMCV